MTFQLSNSKSRSFVPLIDISKKLESVNPDKEEDIPDEVLAAINRLRNELDRPPLTKRQLAKKLKTMNHLHRRLNDKHETLLASGFWDDLKNTLSRVGSKILNVAERAANGLINQFEKDPVGTVEKGSMLLSKLL